MRPICRRISKKIPIVALFFTFNMLPLMQGVIYGFINFYSKVME